MQKQSTSVMVIQLYTLYSGICLIGHTKGPGKCVGLYRMSEYSCVILVSRNTLGPSILFACHRMPEDSCVWLHKIHCIYNCKMMSFLLDCKILHISSKNFGSNYTYMLLCLYNISFVVFMVEPEGKMAEKCIRSGTICHTKHLSIILSDLNSFGPLVS